MTYREWKRVARLMHAFNGELTVFEGALADYRRFVEDVRRGVPAEELLTDEKLQAIAEEERRRLTLRRFVAGVWTELLSTEGER